MSEYLYYDCLNISEEWFKLGKGKDSEQSSDVVFKFIAYWIAFNGIFSKFSNGIDTERHQIEELLNSKKFDSLIGLIDFDKAPECEVFREAPVFQCDRNPHSGVDYLLHNIMRDEYKSCKNQIDNYRNFNQSTDERKRWLALLLTIKQVRNNLFHGQKTPSPDRNYELVNSSQKILEQVLFKLLGELTNDTEEKDFKQCI